MVDAINKERAEELETSLLKLTNLLPKEVVDDLQPSAPQAIYQYWLTLFLMTMQRINQNCTLQSIVCLFAAKFEKKLSLQTGAYSQSRSRLRLQTIEVSADFVAEQLAATSSIVKGRKVYIADGTSVLLTSEAALRLKWPPAQNQNQSGPWPVVKLTTMFNLETGTMLRPEVGVMYGTEAESEIKHGLAMLDRLPANSLLLADRAYGIFGFIYKAKMQGHDVVARMMEVRFQKVQREAEPVAKGVWRAVWKPSRNDTKTHKDLPEDAEVTIYLYRFKGFSGQTMYIASTLHLSVAKVKELYAHRAEVETDIRYWKKQLNMDDVRGKTADMVLKEIAVSSIAFNLVVEVRAMAAKRAEVTPRRLSFARVWQAVVQMILGGPKREGEKEQAWFEYVLEQVSKMKLPNRGRRSYPREAYRKQRTRYPIRKFKPNEDENDSNQNS